MFVTQAHAHTYKSKIRYARTMYAVCTCMFHVMEDRYMHMYVYVPCYGRPIYAYVRVERYMHDVTRVEFGYTDVSVLLRCMHTHTNPKSSRINRYSYH